MPGNPTEDIEAFIADDESPVHAIRRQRPGVGNRVAASLFGWGVTYWVLTDQRVIEYSTEAGGVGYQDVPIGKITSVTYRDRLRVGVLAAGAAVVLLGLALAASHLAGAEIALVFPGVSVPVPSLALGGVLAVLGLALATGAVFGRRRVVVIHTDNPGATLELPIAAGEEINELVRKLNEQRHRLSGPDD